MPVQEVTTSGGVGGFQPAAVGPRRKFRDHADRFHFELKRALGQLDPDELSEPPMPVETRRSPILDRIDRSLNALGEKMWDDLDEDATELRIFIDNDADLYRGQTTSITKNLMTKIGQGTYDRTLAVKLFMYLVDAGAQKYTKEYSGSGTKWHEQFPKKTREAVAASLRDHFEMEASLGNYNNMLPAKYASTDVAAVLKSKGAVTEAIADGVDILPGGILVSTWGYEQTNVDFYKVLEVKGDYAKIVQIASKTTSDGAQSMTGRAVPDESKNVGSPMRRKIKRYDGAGGRRSVAISITSYAGAYPWDGKPVAYSSYA